MKKILIIHTGGTISMLENKETGEIRPVKEHPLSNISKHFTDSLIIDEQVLFDLPSPQITPQHMLKLANEIEKLIPSYDGFIVTHGTDTLEETAYFLDLVLKTNKPVILTGAMRSSNEIGSDALHNLLSSIRVASEGEAREKGVLVVMNDEIHLAENVTKTSTSNVATFQSPQFGPIGILTKEKIIFHRTRLSHTTFKINNMSNDDVILLKAYSGMNEQLFKAVHKSNPRGIVIEALGQGNLPKDTVQALKEIIQDRIPVVLVSRCFKGNVQPAYGYDGGGKQLNELGIIFADGLTGPKARIKLIIALEMSKDVELIKKMFIT
ncbi:asparaginase [Oceanobacillus senegalensis]|uniref:asparaginase n=1 Tax=Oceanobacillus senegalensis TaxID=1936063 RepID=UPI0015C458F6|nr:asparaginase [Oceanobacillus senegalensis]